MKTYRVLLWALALAGLGADQAAKYNVFGTLARTESNRIWLWQADAQHGFALETRYVWVKPDGSFEPHVNQGALFGLGRDNGAYANAVFAAISIAAAAAIIGWSLRAGAKRDLWVCTALGLILAGTLGNLYDRLVFVGVRDFLHWNYLFDWPVFNVADSCLVCGACLLLLQAFTRQAVVKDDKKTASATGDAVTTPASAVCVGVTPAPKV